MIHSVKQKLAVGETNGDIAGWSTELQAAADALQRKLSIASDLSEEFTTYNAGLYRKNLAWMKIATLCTVTVAVGVLLIATVLLCLFTTLIASSIADPVNEIIRQIRALGEGEVDITKKVEINSKDEIGVLASAFNGLMEEFYNMSSFKKVIEEDDSLEDVYSRLGQVFREVIGLKDFVIYEVSNSKHKMTPVYPVVLQDHEMPCMEETLTNCELCRAKKTGHEISSLTFPNICKQFRADVGKDYICIPMIVSGSTGGVVQFLFDHEDGKNNTRDKKVFKAVQFIKEALAVIEAKRLMSTLRESALKDSLTGLYNRRFLQEYIDTLIAGVLRRGKTIGLLMCDLDYFKQVNDLYGHNVGDTVLKASAEIIQTSIRAADLVVRFGGEEFLVLLMDVAEGDTMDTAEKIRLKMQETKVKVPDGTVSKTISVGASEFPNDTDSFWQAIKFADVALYRAKETGRNKSVRFTEDMWKESEF